MNEMIRRGDVRATPAAMAPWREASARGDDTLDARLLVQVLRRRKWQILLIWLLVLIPTVVASLLQQKLYRATAIMQIDPEPMQLLPNANVETPRPAFEVFMRTQEQVLQGPMLLLRVSQRLRSQDDPSLSRETSSLLRRYSAIRLENTQMLSVSYIAPRPGTAAEVANLFTEEFAKLQFEAQQQARENAKELLERDLKKVEDQIQTLEQELVAYSAAHELEGDRLDRKQLADQRLTTLASETLGAESDVAAARAKVAALETSSPDNFPQNLVTPVLQQRLEALLQLEHELTALRTTFGENWPVVVQKRDEMALVRQQLDREKQTVLAQARAQARMDLRAAEETYRALNASKSNQEGRLSQLQSASVQYNILQRNVDTNRKLHEGMLERLKQISVAPGIDLGSIRVIQPALPDSAVVSPRIGWNIFLATVLGLALGVSFALARDYWTNSLSTIEQVEQVTVLPVLAAVPLVRPAQTRRFSSMAAALRIGGRTHDGRPTALSRNSDPRSAELRVALDSESSEAIRALCASLLLSTSERPPRIVVVTSALPGEGKTTIASQLGRALAESGAKTLLVEGDMRRPELSHKFNVTQEGGLSLFLAGQSGQVTVHETAVERLFVAPAGPAAPNPMALLASERLKRFVKEMSSAFHFVIIDTPPLLPMADARVFGATADGVVLVVRAGRASKGLLRRVCTLLDQSGCTVLGAVFNGVDHRDVDSSYYKYYSEYYAS